MIISQNPPDKRYQLMIHPIKWCYVGTTRDTLTLVLWVWRVHLQFPAILLCLNVGTSGVRIVWRSWKTFVIDGPISLIRSFVEAVVFIEIFPSQRSIRPSGRCKWTTAFTDYSRWTSRADQDGTVVGWSRRKTAEIWSSVWIGLWIVAAVLLSGIAVPLKHISLLK